MPPPISVPRSSFQTHFFLTGHAETASELAIRLDGSVPFTVTAWARIESVENAAYILSKDGVFRLGVQGKQLFAEITGFPALRSNGETNPITQGEWHYLACVYTGSELQLYIDGVLDSAAGVHGSGADTANPFLIAHDMQGDLNSVRIYDSPLGASAILTAMFQPDPAQEYVANFDFTLESPADCSSHQLPLTLTEGADVREVTPGVALLSGACCQPVRDPGVTPGAAGDDPYTIQAWIWVERPTVKLTPEGMAAAAQVILVNQPFDGSSGVALYLDYDDDAQHYRLASLRGALRAPASHLCSQAILPFGRWLNVATTYDPATTTLSLYVDGQLDTSSPAFPHLQPFARSNVLIGGAVTSDQPAEFYSLQGYIQTVDVWNVALGAEQLQQWLTDYPVDEPGLTAHYDFSSPLARNEASGSAVGLLDRAQIAPQVSQVLATSQSAPARRAAPRSQPEPEYAQLPDDVMARLRAGVSFADVPNMEKLLDAAMQKELSQNLELFVPAEVAPRLRARLAGEWSRVRHLMRERPLDLRFVISHYKMDGEHILVHHTPVRSAVVYRVSANEVDDCTMWRIQVIWTILMAILSIFGVSGRLSNKVVEFIRKRIFGNDELMAVINFAASGTMTAADLYGTIASLYRFGVLWPLIKLALASMGWWALIKLLLKILVKFFGVAAAVAEMIVALVIAVAQLILVLSQQPPSCPLIPSTAQTTAAR